MTKTTIIVQLLEITPTIVKASKMKVILPPSAACKNEIHTGMPAENVPESISSVTVLSAGCYNGFTAQPLLVLMQE